MGETKFQPQEFSRSGSKAIDVERKREERKSNIMVMFNAWTNLICVVAYGCYAAFQLDSAEQARGRKEERRTLFLRLPLMRAEAILTTSV